MGPREPPLAPATKAYLAAFDRHVRAWADDDLDAYRAAAEEMSRRLPGVFCDHDAVDPREGRPERPLLAPHEEQVISLLAEGVSREEVARELGLRANTVSQYASTGYRKLGVVPAGRRRLMGRREVTPEELRAALALAA